MPSPDMSDPPLGQGGALAMLQNINTTLVHSYCPTCSPANELQGPGVELVKVI